MTRSAVFAFGFVLACAGLSAAQPAETIALAAQSQARHPEEGRPFIRGYQPADVGGTSQIWCILQDKRGVLYAGANSGVLEFDGSNWRRIKAGASATVRSLTMDASGRIYLGGADTFGYLAPDAQGELQFVSLKTKLPAAEQNFNDVWRAFAVDGGVYFQTEQAIFKWANDALTIIKPTSRFNRMWMLEGRLYLTLPENGLNVLENDAFKALPGTGLLALEPYPVIFRYDASRLLIGTRTRGMFLYDGATLTPFRTELDAVLTASQLYRGTPLADGTFALATTANGLVIIDRQGRAVMHVNRANGLPSDVVYYAMPDKEGAVWVALDSGVARLEVPSPASFLDPQEGLPSQPFDMVRVDGRLYAATQTGVFYLSPAGPGAVTPRFESIGVNRSQCWVFGKVAQTDAGGPATLTIACSEGLYEIRGTTARAIYAPADGTFRAAFALPSKVDPTRLWVGLFDGITSFRRRGGHWIDEGRVDGINEQVRSMFENPDGSV
jgi:ligand-binding sensor domain-containing protein